MAAWVARYALFAFGTPNDVAWMMLVGVVLHGICYDFFFVTGQIYTDRKSPADLRGQAQGFLVVLTQGLGMLIGAKINQPLFEAKIGGLSGPAALSRWPAFWWIPAAMAAGVFLVFILLFRTRKSQS
jgi:hypothetical protein